jgi:hypothetical protein
LHSRDNRVDDVTDAVTTRMDSGYPDATPLEWLGVPCSAVISATTGF